MVTKEDLKGSDFNFVAGDVVTVRSRARNEIGWGPFSETGEVKMVETPEVVQRLRQKSKTRDTITVEWDAIVESDSFAIKYELQQARGGGAFRTIYRGQQTEQSSYGLQQGEPHNFRVRASNGCELGRWSEVQIIELSPNVPPTVTRPTPLVEDCGVLITWTEPDGSAVDRYLVEVQDNDM